MADSRLSERLREAVDCRCDECRKVVEDAARLAELWEKWKATRIAKWGDHPDPLPGAALATDALRSFTPRSSEPR